MGAIKPGGGGATVNVVAELDALFAELPEGEVLCGSGGSEVGVGSDHAPAVRTLLGVGDPIAELPQSASAVLYLRPEELTGPDGAFVAEWPGVRGRGVGASQVLNGTPQWWVTSSAGFPLYGTSGGVREVVFSASQRMGTFSLPAKGAGAFTLALVVRNAQLSGATAAVAGFGGNANDRNVSFLSRFNSTSAWSLTTALYSAPTDAAYAITDSGGHPATTDRTLLVARYNGTTLELLEGTAADGSLASVGTRTVTLNTDEQLPIMLGAGATNAPSAASACSIVAAAAWRARLDDTDAGAVYALAVAKGWL